MKLVTIDRQPSYRSGAVIGAEVLDFHLAAKVLPAAQWIPRDNVDVFAGGETGLDLARRIVDAVEGGSDSLRQDLREIDALSPLGSVKLGSPLRRPAIIVCAGQSFKTHHAEMQKRRGIENPTFPAHPRGFLKNPNAVIGPDDAIVLPAAAPDKVDFEGEFAFVIGRPCHNVSRDEAMDCVGGYTILNDVSARDFNGTDKRDNIILYKQFPTFCPMGPTVVTREEIPEPDAVHLKTWLNGELMQSSGMDDLIFTIPDIITYYARFYRFMPGDVITTGTPGGVGHGRNPKIYMKPGDRVEIEIPAIGRLGNPVSATPNMPN